MKSVNTEQIPFRFIVMECCGQCICWVNPRLPSHCPECGKMVYPTIKSWVTFKDDKARLSYHVEKGETVYITEQHYNKSKPAT